MRLTNSLLVALAVVHTAAAQQAVPIVEVGAATARTSATLGGVLGIREVAGGKVLVNDAARRQLWLYDTTLTTSRIMFDSAPGLPNSYGPIRVPLVAYVGDSSLMLDITGGPGSLLVLDGGGQVVRAIALPHPMDAGSFGSNGFSWTDNKGRLLYTLTGRVRGPQAGQVVTQEVYPDSTPVLRADLDARRVDTIGRVARNQGEHTQLDQTDPKKIVRTVIINPLPSADDWAVLTDGSVAFVRGHDYHVDFVRTDGSTFSTPKLPFDWKRVSDDDKKKLIDSAMAAHADQNALATATRNAPPPPPPPPIDPGGGGGQRTAGGAGVTHAAYDAGGTLWVPLDYQTVPLKDIPDYYPAIRAGAAKADLDNHLWVLPTTSAQSRNGELVYDVINTNGELFERVRMPAGRSVAGFGKNGVVYLLSGSKTTGFYLERTRLK